VAVSGATSDFPPPPLTRWGKVWRNLAAILVGGIVWSPVAVAQWQHAPALLFLDGAVGVATLIAMNFRRRWPVPVATFGALAGLVSASSAGAGMIAFISMSTRRRWSEMLPVATLAVVAGEAFYIIEPEQADQSPWYVNLLFSVFFAGIAIAIGMYVGARRELVATLQDRADRAEREQALRVAQAQTNERTRIAREMHDVLAHRMSLVAMHAGALAYRDDLTADQTRDTAEIIQANSHRALADLREILGVLRDADEGAPNRPQPTVADVDTLVADERAAGARITVKNDLATFAGVPESIGRTAYRVIQEGLTNARKHAPNTQVDVIVGGAPGDGLTVEVRNRLPVGTTDANRLPSGFGLVGLSERAAIAHGRIEYGRTPEGDFMVRAWLPWPA
jgi:signal transduction histidine kinase